MSFTCLPLFFLPHFVLIIPCISYLSYHLSSSFPFVSTQACFALGSRISRSTAPSCAVIRAGIRVYSGCTAFHWHACKQSCADRPILSRVALNRHWGVCQTLVAPQWTWHVSVPFHRFQSWLPLCLQLGRGPMWDGHVGAYVGFDRQPWPELGRLLVILRCPFSHLHFAERFDIGCVIST